MGTGMEKTKRMTTNVLKNIHQTMRDLDVTREDAQDRDLSSVEKETDYLYQKICKNLKKSWQIKCQTKYGEYENSIMQLKKTS